MQEAASLKSEEEVTPEVAPEVTPDDGHTLDEAYLETVREQRRQLEEFLEQVRANGGPDEPPQLIINTKHALAIMALAQLVDQINRKLGIEESPVYEVEEDGDMTYVKRVGDVILSNDETADCPVWSPSSASVEKFEASVADGTLMLAEVPS